MHLNEFRLQVKGVFDAYLTCVSFRKSLINLIYEITRMHNDNNKINNRGFTVVTLLCRLRKFGDRILTK